MGRLLRDIFSTVDSDAFEAGRVLWVLGVVGLIISTIGYQGYALYLGQTFDPLQFATGFGTGVAAMLAAGGWGVAKKDKARAEAQATTANNPEVTE